MKKIYIVIKGKQVLGAYTKADRAWRIHSSLRDKGFIPIDGNSSSPKIRRVPLINHETLEVSYVTWTHLIED